MPSEQIELRLLQNHLRWWECASIAFEWITVSFLFKIYTLEQIKHGDLCRNVCFYCVTNLKNMCQVICVVSSFSSNTTVPSLNRSSREICLHKNIHNEEMVSGYLRSNYGRRSLRLSWKYGCQRTKMFACFLVSLKSKSTNSKLNNRFLAMWVQGR